VILWGRASSVNVQKVLWALDEFGEAYDHRVVGGKFGGLDSPGFAALTPVRRVPVLQDGPITVWESHAILRHLARRRPDHPLGRAYADLGQAALTDGWLDYGTSTLQPPFVGLFWQKVRMRDAERDPAQIKAHLAALPGALSVLEAGLSDGRPYLTGETFGIADIGVGATLYRLFDVAAGLADAVPGVVAWRDRLAARDGYIRHVAVSYEELRPA
jgi:glutathione S-transferase